MILNKHLKNSFAADIYKYFPSSQISAVCLIHKIPKYEWHVPNREGLFINQKYKFMKMKELMRYKIRHSFRNESI
jgi:hypothetical protein